MAYKRENLVTHLEYDEFDPKWMDDPRFEMLTFDYAWKTYSGAVENGRYVETLEVPELKDLVVPGRLFRCLGSYTFMKGCFPNCTVTFV